MIRVCCWEFSEVSFSSLPSIKSNNNLIRCSFICNNVLPYPFHSMDFNSLFFLFGLLKWVFFSSPFKPLQIVFLLFFFVALIAVFIIVWDAVLSHIWITNIGVRVQHDYRGLLVYGLLGRICREKLQGKLMILTVVLRYLLFKTENRFTLLRVKRIRYFFFLFFLNSRRGRYDHALPLNPDKDYYTLELELINMPTLKFAPKVILKMI